jgi:hypothetical protein
LGTEGGGVILVMGIISLSYSYIIIFWKIVILAIHHGHMKGFDSLVLNNEANLKNNFAREQIQLPEPYRQQLIKPRLQTQYPTESGVPTTK